MAKYSLAFKLRVVRYRARYPIGSRATAAHFGIDHGTVRKWCAAYAEHGEDGLKKRYRRYSSAFKKAVLRRMTKEGWSVRQASAFFNIAAPTTLHQWQRAFAQGGATALDPKRSTRRTAMAKPKSPASPLPRRPKAPEHMTTNELHERLAYLEAENAYLKKLKALAQEKRSVEKKRRG